MTTAVLALALLSPPALFAQVEGPGGPPRPTAKVVLPARAVAGSTVVGRVEFTIPATLHAYPNPPADPANIPVSLSTAESGFQVSKIEYPAGFPKAVGGSDTPIPIYEGTVKIPFRLRVPTQPGRKPVTLQIRYQLCDDRACYPPSTLRVRHNLTVTRP